jgi:hypothetical protein
MSCVVKRSTLTQEQRTKIVKDLTLHGKATKYGKGKIIKLFDYNKNNDEITLPYHYASGLLDEIPNQEKSFPSTSFVYHGTLREKQAPVAELALEHLIEYGTTTLSLHPGFGKTHLATYLARRLKLVTLVLVPPNNILVGQWVNTFIENTTAKVWQVGKKNKYGDDVDVIICSNKSIHKIPESIAKRVGTLIVDEAHLFCTQLQTKTFFAFQPAYIIIETATLEREDDGLHTMIWNIAGQHEISRPFEEAFTVNFLKLKTDVIRGEYETKGEMYRELVNSYLVDGAVNSTILKLVEQNKDKRILILTKRVFHAEFLVDKIGDRAAGLYGDTKTYKNCDVLVGTTSKIGTGFDPANTCQDWDKKHFDLVISVVTFKKVSSMVQNYGRGFRSEDPVIYQLVFDDNIFVSHTYRMKKWCLEHGGTVKDVKMDK